MRRCALGIVGTLVVTGLCTAYVLWKIDLGKTAHILDANALYFLAALALMVVTILPMAWRWQLLLKAKGVHEEIPWLTRAYFVSYAAGQVLPTSVGGDAVRIYETARRHPGQGNTAAASGPARARDRRRGDPDARRRRLPARGRALRRRPLPLDRGALRRRDGHPRRRAFLASRPAAPCHWGRCCASRSGRPARARRLQGDPLLPRQTWACSFVSRADARVRRFASSRSGSAGRPWESTSRRARTT